MASAGASVSSVLKPKRQQSAAMLRARAAQNAPCCDKYAGMALFSVQMSLDQNPELRRFMLENESMETGELWLKLHEHG